MTDIYYGIDTGSGPLDVDRTGSSLYLYLDRSSGQPFFCLFPPRADNAIYPFSSCQHFSLRMALNVCSRTSCSFALSHIVTSSRNGICMSIGQGPGSWASWAKEGTSWQPCLPQDARRDRTFLPIIPTPHIFCRCFLFWGGKNSKASWVA